MRKKRLFLLLILLNFVISAADRITGKTFATRSEIISTRGMVASSHPLATQIGLQILQGGGNAVDAAIAVNAALGLMEPTGCGIGGDLFALIYDQKTKRVYGFNASGYCSESINRQLLASRGITSMPAYGALPVTVPGCVAGWFELHKKFGQLKMEKILQPTIEYAEQGFPLPEVIAYYWRRGLTLFKNYDQFQKTFGPWKRLPEKGDLFSNPDLARTYKKIARYGKDAFYQGEIAQAIVRSVKENGGFLTLNDLKNYQPEWVTPLQTDFFGYQIVELPPNTQGIAVLLMLNMLKEFDLKGYTHNSKDYLHLLVELKKLAYEVLGDYCADPRFSEIPLEKILSPEFSRKLLANFSSQKIIREIKSVDQLLQEADTVYLTVVDSKRNVVSLIQSNYSGFGSGIVPEGSGFCLQNRGSLFSLNPEHRNCLEPRKRPFHTIIPAMVLSKGQPVFSFGVMGGDMQPQGHLQILLNIILFKMNLQEAGDAPRFYHSGSSDSRGEKMTDGGILYLESGIDYETQRELTRLGHRIQINIGGFGGFQGIWIDWQRGILSAGSESRKDGNAAGY